MRNLAEDRDEAPDAAAWVGRARRRRFIGPHEPTVWLVSVEQATINGQAVSDRDVVWLGASPGDALDWAALYAHARDARRAGTGRWVLEVYGDGENSPRVLVVRPALDVEALAVIAAARAGGAS